MSTDVPLRNVFVKAIDAHLELVRDLQNNLAVLEKLATLMAESLRNGGTIFWCGNGGSAADCQHLAAEIVGRFRRERRGLPSIALTTDTSVITAVANDYGYERVFSRQLEALAKPGDLVVGISTSGKSQNVIAALEQARNMGVTAVAFTGEGGGELAQIAETVVAVGSKDTARVQECHILIGHMLCEWLEIDHLESQSQMVGRGVESQ